MSNDIVSSSLNTDYSLYKIIDSGFKEMRENVFELKEELSMVRSGQIRMEEEIKAIRKEKEELKETVTGISDAMYDPDKGIYTRINEGYIHTQIRDSKFDKVAEKIDKIEQTLSTVKQTDKILTKIAGENLEELQAVIKTKKTVNKILWTILIAIITAGIGFFWNLYS